MYKRKTTLESFRDDESRRLGSVRYYVAMQRSDYNVISYRSIVTSNKLPEQINGSRSSLLAK